MNKPIFAEYIWIDGTPGTRELRSKTKAIYDATLSLSTAVENVDEIKIDKFPQWGADGSSTMQAAGSDSDITLEPVRAIRDPFRSGHYLVLCEVYNGRREAHTSNKRVALRKVLDAGAAAEKPYFGFEQEYTFMNVNGRPMGFPDAGFPGEQGPYYCGVGTGKIVGRDIYEEFLMACSEAGVHITGVNWEVMPGQAEVQVAGDALKATDHVWLTRWILHRVAEKHGVCVSLDAKPASGDWNGAGMHTNFSTDRMRSNGGMDFIVEACKRMEKRVPEHLAVYGQNYEARLTGAHETCSFREFRYGVSDRTASIRIPRGVAEKGCGYLEDRRPNANADPYEIATVLLQTVCAL